MQRISIRFVGGSFISFVVTSVAINENSTRIRLTEPNGNVHFFYVNQIISLEIFTV